MSDVPNSATQQAAKLEKEKGILLFHLDHLVSVLRGDMVDPPTPRNSMEGAWLRYRKARKRFERIARPYIDSRILI